MNNYKSTIYTIIVTYNAVRWIDRVVIGLLESTYKTSIIIVDNGSTDGTQELILEKYNKYVHLIDTKLNLGFGRANNFGIKYAIDRHADYVFLLNQDAWVNKDTLANLVEIANKNTGFGIISPIHLNGKGDKLDVNFSHYAAPFSCPDFYSDLCFYRFRDLYPCNFVNAAAWLISKECIRKVGGFNPNFFMYGEDDEYVERVKFHNFKIGIVPLAYIYHDREERKVLLDRKTKKAKYEVKAKLILLDLKASPFKAYYRFLRFSISSFIHLTPTIFENFVKIHSKLLSLIKIKSNLKRAGAFNWVDSKAI
jgi:GT2 family glycosyltransferase